MPKLNDVFKATVKKCGHCREILPLERFAYKNKRAGTRHSICRSCKSVYLKEYYKENREQIIEQRKELQEKRRRFKERIQQQYSDTE